MQAGLSCAAAPHATAEDDAPPCRLPCRSTTRDVRFPRRPGLIARECSVGQDEIETCLESGYAGKLLPRVSDELVEALAVMKSFLHERRFIARDFELEDWIDSRALVEAYRLEGLEEVASTLWRPAAGRGTVWEGK